MRIFLTAFLSGLFCIFGSSAAEKTPDTPVADARLFSAVTVEELGRRVPEAKELYEGPWGRHDFIVLTCRFFPVREWLGSMNSDVLEPLSGGDTELKLIQLLVLKESGTGFTIEDAGGYLESSKQVFSAKNRKTVRFQRGVASSSRRHEEPEDTGGNHIHFQRICGGRFGGGRRKGCGFPYVRRTLEADSEVSS